jgi:nitrous oxidase accessory protein
MQLRFLGTLAVALLLGLISGTAHPSNAAETVNTWTVSPQGPLSTIQQALEQASEGDTIRVKPGLYLGPVVVDQSVTLVGEGYPVIDGGGEGMVVSLNAPGIRLSGFEIRGSGSEPDRDHAGIVLTAPDILVEDNRLYDVLFGIFVAEADRAIVRNNDITSKEVFDVARKGDAIRIWYSQDATIENNLVHEARDLVAWYSKNLVFRNNTIQNGRYGIHLMYSDNATISNNLIYNNSVGIYVMYSRQVKLLQNDIRRQRGPSGYALGFKDSDDILAQHNLLIDNRAGVFLDGTPYRPGSYARFEDNILAFNDIGVLLFSFVSRVEFLGNTLWENVQQTALQGTGKAGDNTWEGNYWSDYTGYDADGNGVGDVPYRSERFFEGLLDQEPRLRALLFSPAAQAIEFASLSFPVIKPQPKLEDPAPSVVALNIPASALNPPSPSKTMIMVTAGAALILAGGLLFLIGISGEKKMVKTKEQRGAKVSSPSQQTGKPVEKPLVQISGLTKRYGKVAVLKDFNLEIFPGEALALWGENGAGKTTLLKAILGLLHFEGDIQVDGESVARKGKQARAHIGYVPQEAVFYDMTVQDTLVFYCRLKKASPGRIPPLLEQLGLEAHAHKPVPALSGGLKQRLALAVALLSDPPLLLLDEPTANLDTRARRDYLELLLKLRETGKTILFASHRLDEVETLARRTVILQGGQKLEEIEPGKLRGRLAPQVVLTLWVPAEQRTAALSFLHALGWDAHLNGRGTLVVQINAEEKMRTLQNLAERGISVQDFEIEGASFSWN